jgi:hypothetical protein
MLAVFNETLHHKRSMQIFIHQNSNVIIIMDEYTEYKCVY